MDFDINSLYKFNKSYKERFDDYYSILCGSDGQILSIHERWANYLEFSFSLTSYGWIACWNILRNYCEKLKITFPKVIHVRVVNVDYETLSADVTIINWQDDEELCLIPSVIESVPLKDLYVTTLQEDPDIDITLVAECLDQLRVFYHHLWWPWIDERENNNNETSDWVSYNLEYRLKLYFDKIEGNIHYVSAKIIKRLLEKSKEYHDLLKNFDSSSELLKSADLFLIYNELNSMRIDLNQWCIPEMRKLKNEEIIEANKERGILIILRENEIDDVETFLSSAQDSLYSENLDTLPVKMVNPNFDLCHVNYNANDVILLAPGNYELNYIEYFDFPVLMRGLKRSSSLRRTVISDTRSFWSIFQFLASRICIRNIDFDVKFCRTVFIIKRGVVVLNDVHLRNVCSDSGPYIGIQLYKNTKLIAHGCRFSNFNTAIVCMPGSSVELDDCTFEKNSTCIQFVRGAQITMNKCDLRNTENTPFVYEHCLSDCEFEEGESLEHLSKIAGVAIDQIQVDDESSAVENI